MDAKFDDPMFDLADDQEEVKYRIQSSAWMYSAMFNDWLNEPKAISNDFENKLRVTKLNYQIANFKTMEIILLDQLKKICLYLFVNAVYSNELGIQQRSGRMRNTVRFSILPLQNIQ